MVVGIHGVMVILLAGLVAGHTITLDNRRDVHVVGRDLILRQRRVQRFIRPRRKLETVIPTVAHKSDNIIDIAG